MAKLENIFEDNTNNRDDKYYLSSLTNIQIFNNDCLIKMSDIADKSIDLILCDLLKINQKDYSF